jgi:uncharacterized protein (DUF1499 family)
MRIQSLFLLTLLISGSKAFTTREPMLLQRTNLVRCLSLPQQTTTNDSSLSCGRDNRHNIHVVDTILPVMFLSGLLLATTPPSPAWAEEVTAEQPAVSSRIMEACRKNPGVTTNCVSTRNVKQLDMYAPPWTFESSAEEAMARLKGVVASDPNLELIHQDNLFLTVKATRSGGIFTDTIQFELNSKDQVVTFKAEQDGEPSMSDFGAIRKELDTIRQRGQIFGIMGQGVMSADSMPSQNGPIGQLKAFYGLQSGQGYEDVFDEN